MTEETGMCEARKKYWSELSDREKLERMRGEVKTLEGRVAFLNKMLIKLADHSHDSKGQPVIRFEPYHELRDIPRQIDKDKVFF